MHAMAVAGIDAFEPDAVVHDLGRLEYEWGDMLELVLGAGATSLVDGQWTTSPTALAIGPGCEEAVRTLILGGE